MVGIGLKTSSFEVEGAYLFVLFFSVIFFKFFLLAEMSDFLGGFFYQEISSFRLYSVAVDGAT